MTHPNDTTFVPLSRGMHAVIDTADADLVLPFTWSVMWSGRRWYARRGIGGRANHRHIYLHRFLLNAPSGMHVDHINGDGLDCRRGNIRIATGTQNAGNCGPRVKSLSGLRGVGWSTKESKWIASIQYEKVKQRLGAFDDSVAAARVYDAKARELFGEFAFTNFKD